MTRSAVVLSALSLVALAACSSDESAQKGDAPAETQKPSRREIKLSELEVEPPQLLVAKPCPRKLVLVVDEEQVPTDLGTVKWAALVVHSYIVTEGPVFVERDLARSLEPFFESVEVRSKEEGLEGATMVGDVRVDGISSTQIGQARLAELKWAFALRPVEADHYLFSYAGTSQSDPQRSSRAMVQSALEKAIGQMMSAFTEEDAHRACLALPPADASPPPAAPGQEDV